MGGGLTGVSITVDVDGEAGLPDGGRGHADRLTSRSERAYGITRGLPRILDVLAEHRVAATFYVPGATALAHPDAVRALLAAGHELGHHGHHHLPTAGLAPARERAELIDGLAALRSVAGGSRVDGYRSPGWELTPVTLALLGEHGFAWDSSLMGDDRPYELAAGDARLVELPVHWSLDDAPHFARGGDPAALLAVWTAELHEAWSEDRHVTFTLHPEILGRGHRVDVLRRVLELAAGLGAPVLTHGEAVRRLRARQGPPPSPGTPGPRP